MPAAVGGDDLFFQEEQAFLSTSARLLLFSQNTNEGVVLFTFGLYCANQAEGFPKSI